MLDVSENAVGGASVRVQIQDLGDQVHITSASVRGQRDEVNPVHECVGRGRAPTTAMVEPRVLPEPPAPVSVTSRTPERNSAVRSAISRCLPTSVVAGTGNLDDAPRDLEGRSLP